MSYGAPSVLLGAAVSSLLEVTRRPYGIVIVLVRNGVFLHAPAVSGSDSSQQRFALVCAEATDAAGV